MKKVLVVALSFCSLLAYPADIGNRTARTNAAVQRLAYAAADEEEVKISVGTGALGFPPPIPVTLSGFSGEVDQVLRFDLSFMGFEFVTPDKARYNIQKNSAAGVGAQITDPLSHQSIYNKAFTGPSTRQ